MFYIIVPCHNEENNIQNFISEIEKTLKTNNIYKILFIDDGSEDKTWDKINLNFNKNKRISGIKLSKNFGKESAIEAGLNKINNDDEYHFAIIIDADLQHPISKIPEMISEWKKNYKIVTTFKENNVENIFRKFGSDLFYSIMSKYSDVKFVTKNTDFMLLDKSIVKVFNKLPEKNKFLKVFANWTGFKNKSIGIKINPRESGTSKYNFVNLFRTAINAITSFSLMPIKIVGYLGLIMSVLSIILLPILIILNIIGFTPISVQTLIIIFNVFLTGIILSAIGLLGIYISRIHENTIKRPSFIIEDEKIQ